MINQEYRRPFIDRLRRRGLQAATALGGVSLAAACASPQPAEQPESPMGPSHSVSSEPACTFNGEGGDVDPHHLNKGEAAAVFPGTIEYDITNVRPLLELGEQGVRAAFALVYNPEAKGFRLEPIPPINLANATWKVDTTKVDPAAPQKMAQFDGCRPDEAHAQDRNKVPVSFVTLAGVVETALDQTPDPHGLKLQAPTYLEATELPPPDGAEPRPPKAAISEWFARGVYGVSLSNPQAKQLGKTLSEIEVPLTGS